MPSDPTATDPSTPRLRLGRGFWSGVLAGASLLAAQVAWTLPFVADDTLISLRYSQRLLAGQGLTFTDGEVVEGYSNLLLVLGAAGLGALGLDLITAARVVCGVGALAAIAAVAAYGARRCSSAAVAGGALVGATLSLGHWVAGGLEQPLLAGLLAAALMLLLESDRRGSGWAWAGGCLALACLTRPDAPLFVVVAGLWAGWRGRRALLAVALPGVFAVLAQLAFRWVTYGDYVPNTAHAKLAMSWHRLSLGAEYLAGGAPGLGVLGLVALVGARRVDARARWLLLSTTIVWLAYVVSIGGDLFPARRHLLAACVPLWFLASEAVDGWRRWTVPGIGLLVLGHGFAQDALDPSYRRGRLERWEWECGVLATAVGREYREAAPLLAVNAAGCWPYFSELPALDMLGLNDAHIARSPSPLRGQGHLGHELGDGAYVLSRQPDLVVFGIWSGSAKPGYRGDRELAASPSFARDYRLVRFAAKGRSALIWVRRESPRIGPQREGKQIEIPVTLAGSPTERVVVTDGGFETHIAEGRQAELSIRVPPGRWRAHLGGRGRARLSLAGGKKVDGATLDMAPGSRMVIRVLPEGPFVLTELGLTQVE